MEKEDIVFESKYSDLFIKQLSERFKERKDKIRLKTLPIGLIIELEIK